MGLGLTDPTCEVMWEDRNVFNLGFGGGYTGVCVCQKLISCALVGTFYCI